ncbi:MAG: hypothetical protein ACREO1_08730 [Arenimonas sp.]
MARLNNTYTMLLAGFLLWAGLVLLVSFFGLGARFNPLPVDMSLAKAIPTVKIDQGKAILEPIENYAEVGTRPLLMFDRRPGIVQAAPGDNSGAELDVVLGSVLLTPNLKMAIFRENQGGAVRRVRLGDTIEGTGWRLVQLDPRRAVLEGPTGQRSLDLLVYNGKGGEPPTALTAANAATPENADTQPMTATAPPAQPAPNTTNVAANAAPANQNLTQEQQIEAIRKRIAARRAQMQADAAKAASDAKK